MFFSGVESHDLTVVPRMLTSRLFLFVFLSSFVITVLGNLEQVNDTDLEKLIANEKFVIVLFREGRFFGVQKC